MDSQPTSESQTPSSRTRYSLTERAAFAGYTIPEWSHTPDCPYALEVVKGGVLLQTIPIDQQPFYLIGRNADVSDIVPEHPSLSRIHAVLQMGKEGRIELLDFKSTHGSFINGKQIKAFQYYPLHVGDFIQFGGSLRMYTLTGPTDKMQPETKVQLRPEDRPTPREEPAKASKTSSESQGKVKVAPIRIRFLGERPSDVNRRIQQEIANGLWDADDADDDAMALENENETDRSILGADFDPSDLTEQEQRQFQKIAELRAKRAKLRSNSQRRSNSGTNGTNGREALAKLEEQIDSMEQSLYDSVERRRSREARRRGQRERLLDEEDSYYDRTDRKRTRRTMPESRAALQEKLAYKEKSLKFYRAELAASEAQPEQAEGDGDDPLEQFMRENERKVRETKQQILREKIRTAEKDILDITNRLSEMLPPPTSSEAAMNPPTPVLRLRGKESNARDTSTYTVINPTNGSENAGDAANTKNTKDSGEEGAKTANSAKSSKKSKNPSGAYLSSFGSVLESLKAGKNTSFDDQKPSSSSTSAAWKPSMNVAPNPANARKSKKNALYDGGSGNVEGVDVGAGVDQKVRDMKEYHIPKDLNVAINKEALDEVVEELGSNQPAFMKRMISELKDK